jgi:exopolysaccharide biosynthesis operon protein EpsL
MELLVNRFAAIFPVRLRQPAQRLRYGLMACAALGLAVGDSRAQSTGESHWLKPSVEYSLMYDANLLRTPDMSAPPGRAGLSDQVRSLGTGLALERHIARQTITARWNVTHIKFERFSVLDYDSRDQQLNWNWLLGSHFHGNIGSSSQQTLTPFVETHTERRNLRTNRRNNADAVWMFHPKWQLQWGATRVKYDYDLSAERLNNRNVSTQDLGLNYLGKDGNKIGLFVRHTETDFPIDASGSNNFIEDEVKLRIDYSPGGKSVVHFVGGKTERSHKNSPMRDYNGINARLIGSLYPTGQQAFTVNLWREIGAIDNLITSYTLNQGTSLAWIYVPLSKVRIDGQISHENRDYNNNGSLGVPRNDIFRSASLNLSYTPWQRVQLGLGFSRDTLTSSQFFRSYRTFSISTNVRYQY